jgi:hypothetical protein
MILLLSSWNCCFRDQVPSRRYLDTNMISMMKPDKKASFIQSFLAAPDE